MKVNWPLVPLGELMARVEDTIPIHADTKYREVTVRLWGKGVTLRRECFGVEIKSDRRTRVRTGQFIASRIDARNGAFGVIPPELDGAVVTNDFPTFSPRNDRLDNRFLEWMSKTASFVDLCKAASEGTTNRVRLKEDRFLATAIPLPPIGEQRRIVARIEALAAKIAEARGLRAEVSTATGTLCHRQLAVTFAQLESDYGTTPLDSVIEDAGYGTSVKCQTERGEGLLPVLRIPNVASETTNLAQLKFGPVAGGELNRVLLKPDDLLIVRTNGSRDLVGRCAVVRGLKEPTAFASYLIRIQFDRKVIDPNFAQLMLRFLRDDGRLIDFARTTAGQYNVSLGRLRSAAIPVPDLQTQRATVAGISRLYEEIDVLKSVQSATAAELTAMLPSVLDRAFKGDL